MPVETTNGLSCSCDKAGFCYRRGTVLTEAHFQHCQNGHGKIVDQFYAAGVHPQITDLNQLKNIGKPIVGKNKSDNIGTALVMRIKGLTGVGPSGGCQCKTIADQMDAGGKVWVEQNRQYILDAMVKNKDELIQAVAGTGHVGNFASWIGNTSLGADALRLGAEWLLDGAIQDVAKVKKDRRVIRITGGIDDSPVTTDYNVQPGTWTSDVRHLTMHVWATLHNDSWQWNLGELASRWTMFNGKKILAVVSDERSHPVEVVVEYARSLGMEFDNVLSMRNEPRRREVVTWIPMIELLHPETAGANEVVFACHAKGAQHAAAGSHMRSWADLMYKACLDYWPATEAMLSQYMAAGAFRRFGTFATPGNKKWHYSGTFFWWRLAEIGRRDWRHVDQQFFGSESWIGHQCYRNETGCLFHDDTHDLYQPDYWESSVWPAWKQYEEARR